MDSPIGAAKMMADIMNLSMAVMTAGNTVISFGLHYLVKLYFAVGLAGIRET